MNKGTIHCIVVSNYKPPAYVPLSGPTVEDAVREQLTDKQAPIIEAGIDRDWLDRYVRQRKVSSR